MDLAVVEDDVVGAGVELVQVEEPLEVRVTPKRPREAGLSGTRVADDEEGLGSVRSVLVKSIDILLNQSQMVELDCASRQHAAQRPVREDRGLGAAPHEQTKKN